MIVSDIILLTLCKMAGTLFLIMWVIGCITFTTPSGKEFRSTFKLWIKK